MAYDAIVVGAGVMGLAAAAELGSRGQRVLVLDQFSPHHTNGSSHGETRVIRTAYFEHSDYVPLAKRAWDAWQGLDGNLLLRTGGLYLGRPTSELISGSIGAAEMHGLSHAVKGAEEVRIEHPQLSIPDDYVGFAEAQCGILWASKCIDALEKRAVDAGVEVTRNTRVGAWGASSDRVTVSTSTAEYQATRLILCAGAWTAKLLSDLSLPLRVTRQVVGFTEPLARAEFNSDQLPVMCMESPDGAFYYTIPICAIDGSRSSFFKVARHNAGATVDPESVDRSPGPDDAESFLPGLREFLPGALGPIQAMDVCLYTSTPDGNFIVDKHPEHENVVFGCGFSGHGFKFAPVIGEALADFASNGESNLPVDFLSLARFRD